MPHKPVVVVDPFAGTPFGRLARRRFLALSGPFLHGFAVPAPPPDAEWDERDLAAAAMRCRRHGVEPLLLVLPANVIARDRARRLGYAGLLADREPALTILHPPALPHLAAILVEGVARGDSDAALRDRFGEMLAAGLADVLDAILDAGVPATLIEARSQLRTSGDTASLERLLGRWSEAGNAVARLDDRRLAREIAPVAAALHAIGEAGVHALRGDACTAWDVWSMRLANAGPIATASAEAIDAALALSAPRTIDR
jgi:hypothetical protein